MKHYLLGACIAGCVLMTSCSDTANNQRPTEKYEGTKATMAGMEKESPLKFLRVTGSYRNNLVNQTVIEGDVTNQSSLTTYKNVEIRVNFKDKEGTVLEKQQHTLDDIVKPGTTVDFKIKVKHVKGAASATFDIVDAVADK